MWKTFLCIIALGLQAGAVDSATFSVEDPSTSNVCILLEFKAALRIPFNKADNKVDVKVIDLPSNFNVSGSCAVQNSFIHLQWQAGNSGNNSQPWALALQFQADFSKPGNDSLPSSYYVSNISLFYFMDDQLFPGTVEFGERSFNKHFKSGLFRTEVGAAFVCITDSAVSFTDQLEGLGLDLADLKVEAFRSSNSTDFSSKETYCAKDAAVNTIVPIAVGCALALLVICVLVAYFVTRRGNNQTLNRGYQTI